MKGDGACGYNLSAPPSKAMRIDRQGTAEEVAAFVAERVPPDGCVVLIGGVDVGKTTLARALNRRLGGEVLDADLGQSTIGSPTAITLGTYDGGMRDGYFVGDTTPRGHLVLALCGTLRMARRARRPLVVDTDGFIAGNVGRSYKLALIEALDPDLVVLLPRGMELELLRLSCAAETVCVRISGVRQKTREERISTREANFRAEFARCREVEVPWEEVRWRGTLLGLGEPVDPNTLSKMLGCEVLYARRAGNEAIAVVDGRPLSAGAVKAFWGLEELYLIPKSYMEDRLIGCFRGGRFVGLGRVSRAMPGKLVLSVPQGEVPEAIQPGCLRITASGRELGRSLLP